MNRRNYNRDECNEINKNKFEWNRKNKKKKRLNGMNNKREKKILNRDERNVIRKERNGIK